MGNVQTAEVMALPPEMQRLCESLAAKWGVIPDIHPQDFIFQNLWTYPGFESKDKALEVYFDDGANSAQRLAALLREVCGFKDKPCRLLEFASGYGCVTRHLKNAAPFCAVTSCDIHPEAMRFIESRLGVETVLSASVPEELRLEPVYDVVFALSFFSHMPKRTFGRWLRRLASFVKADGYLILTTHGLVTRLASQSTGLFDADGFYFAAGSEQRDLDSAEYGSTIVKPRYVLGELARLKAWTAVHFQEGYWWNHQDLYVWRRISDLMQAPPPTWRQRARQVLA